MSMRRMAFVWLAGLMTAIGLIAAVVSYAFVRNEASEFLDNQLRQIALYVGDARPSTAQPPPEADPHDPEDDFAIQIWDVAGKMLRESKPDVGIPSHQVTGFFNVHTPVDTWRVYTLVGPDRIVQVSQQMSVRDELAADEALRAILPIGLLVPLSWLVLSWVIQHVMGRMNQLARVIASRGASETQPIALTDIPLELVPFVISINGLLAKLQSLIDQQRNLISDAAHELRTPLFGLQLQADNLRDLIEQRSMRHDGRQGAVADGLDTLHRGIRRVSDLVNQLLRLAKYDADPAMPVAASFDLTRLTLATVARADTFAVERGINLGLLRQEAVDAFADEADIDTILSNLLDNAIRYTQPTGNIDVSVYCKNTMAVIEVQDNGPGIDQACLPKVFERFFRAAPAAVEGSGLGLAIAKAAAERNHATLTIENRRDGRGLLVRVNIPCGARA